MKRTISIATNKTVVTTYEKEVDFPDNAVYYAYNDNGIFFAEGLILFAIIPRYEGADNYTLLQVRRNKQEYIDFYPSDCNSDHFLDYKGLRNKALDILVGKNNDFKPITEEEFNTKRIELLNSYQII